MSYCRWSSDNWKSDVYIYDGSEGITCHVATLYYEGYIPKLPDIRTATPEEMAEGWKRQKNGIKKCIRKKHESVMAGDTFYTKDPVEMISYLRFLQQEGFHVPAYVFDDLEAI